MQQVFVTLQYLLKDKTVDTFVKHFDDRRIFQYDDYFLLDQERINRLFQANLTALQSEITIPLDFFDNSTKVIAMTIDGDFILANDLRTYVVPKNMIKADLEVFDLTLIDFFVQYEEQQLHSSMIQTVTLPEGVDDSFEDVIESPETPKTSPDALNKKGFFSRFFGK